MSKSLFHHACSIIMFIFLSASQPPKLFLACTTEPLQCGLLLWLSWCIRQGHYKTAIADFHMVAMLLSLAT